MATDGITEEEAALYDRQIRLWGLESQKQLRVTKVCLIGLGGLGAEVGKNLVLAGIDTLALVDDKPFSELDFTAQYLISHDRIGENRAVASVGHLKKLNPRVNVIVPSETITEIGSVVKIVPDYDVVIATGQSMSVMKSLNSACRQANCMFLGGSVFGMAGYFFTDFGSEHKYMEEEAASSVEARNEETTIDDDPDCSPPKRAKISVDKDKEEKKIAMQKTAKFATLDDMLTRKPADWSDLTRKVLRREPWRQDCVLVLDLLQPFLDDSGRCPHYDDLENLTKRKSNLCSTLKVDQKWLPVDNDLDQLCEGEFSPVCAIVGGLLSQEVIKGVTHSGRPVSSFSFFNGLQGTLRTGAF